MQQARPVGQKNKFLDRQITTRQLIFVILIFLCLTPWITPPVALGMGLIAAQFIGHPFLHLNHKATTWLLQVSVVGLGFGINAGTAWQAGRQGALFTVISIAGTLLLGAVLGKLLATDKKTSFLVSCGTAICGGSAIAALAPVISARENQMSVALGTVFILNAVALFLFPVIGHTLHLSETQFGLWCAIAIHDTSAVVGAAGKYGPHALAMATTVKLLRALWIIPVAMTTALLCGRQAGKIKIPYFIGCFVLAIALNTCLPAIAAAAPVLVTIARIGLTLTLFLIGAGLSAKVLRSVGVGPFLQGALLWIIVSLASLYAVIALAHH